MKLEFLLSASLTQAHLADLASSNIARAMLELKEAQPRAAHQFPGAISTERLEEECVRTLSGDGWKGEYVITAYEVMIKEAVSVTEGYLETVPNPEYKYEYEYEEDKWGEEGIWKKRVLSPQGVTEYLHRWVAGDKTRELALSDVIAMEAKTIEETQSMLRENVKKNKELLKTNAVLRQHRNFLRKWFLGEIEDKTHVMWGKPATPEDLWSRNKWDLAKWGVITPEEVKMEWSKFASQQSAPAKLTAPAKKSATPHLSGSCRATGGEKAENPFAALAALKRK